MGSSGTSVLYIGRTVPKGQMKETFVCVFVLLFAVALSYEIGHLPVDSFSCLLENFECLIG